MDPENRIYLDNNSTTPVDEVVLDAMMPYFSEKFANAASRTHLSGRSASRDVEASRKAIAGFLGADPEEIHFTSGATESINIALQGITKRYREKGDHIITWATEHSAVMETLEYLSHKGTRVSILPVRRDGTPEISTLENVISERTVLIVCMAANNETGVISPLSEISDIAEHHHIPLFSDATQAIGKIPFQFRTNGVHIASFSAHKFYGPKGIGGLYVSRRSPRVLLEPLAFGGGHEKGLRPGTLNVPGIIGMAKALEVTEQSLWEEMSRISELRTRLEQQLEAIGDVHINGSVKSRLPNTTNLMIKGVSNERLITSTPGLEFAVGSACTSVVPKPSHVLKAMGLSDEECKSSIRMSLGRFTSKNEIDSAINLLRKAIADLRETSELY